MYIWKRNCWYNHETEELHNDKEKDNENENNANIINKNGIETEEVIQRIMQMMETLTERILDIEIKKLNKMTIL